MAIKVTNQKDDEPKSISLDVDNGDRVAIDTLLERYKFKDVESLIRYALAALLEAGDNVVYVKKNGETVALKPNDTLLQRKPKIHDTLSLTNKGLNGISRQKKTFESFFVYTKKGASLFSFSVRPSGRYTAYMTKDSKHIDRGTGFTHHDGDSCSKPIKTGATGTVFSAVPLYLDPEAIELLQNYVRGVKYAANLGAKIHELYISQVKGEK